MTGAASEPTLDEALRGASRRLLATPAVLLVLLTAFGASVRWGDLSLWDPTAWQLFRCGGAFGPAIAEGEWWRFATPILVHAGIVHLGVNLAAVWELRRAERVFGAGGYLVIFVLSGIGGNLLGVLVRPFTVLVGASGGVMGVAGALLVFALLHRGVVPAEVLRTERRRLGFVVVANLAIPLAIPAISLSGHLGGFLTGVVAGLLLQRDLLRPSSGREHRARRAGAMLLVLAVLAVGVRFQISRSPEFRAVELLQESRTAAERGDAGRAEELATRALELNRNGRAYLARGVARWLLGKRQGALEDLDEAVRLLPSDADVWRARGWAREGIGERLPAIADYERALELEPEDGETRSRLEALRGRPVPPPQPPRRPDP